MEKESLLGKIKSSFIIKNISLYIREQNIFFKLLIYSKSLQKRINIELIDYQKVYSKKRIKWELYPKFYEYDDIYKKYLRQ